MPLAYDGNAFAFFALSCLTLYAVPAGLYTARRILSVFTSTAEDEAAKAARSKEEEAKLRRLAKAKRSVGNTLTAGFLCNLLVLAVVVWIGYGLLGEILAASDDIAEWDPYEVLGLEEDATPRAIKKAYRTESLRWHPDKNPGDKNAERRFVEVTRAHEILTDEEKRENFLRTGNPDGTRQAIEVAIGLPEWLSEKDGQRILLVAYLAVLVLLLPCGVWCFYSNSSQFNNDGVLRKTEAFYRRAFDVRVSRSRRRDPNAPLRRQEPPPLRVHEIPQFIASAEEFKKDMPTREGPVYAKLARALRDEGCLGSELTPRLSGSKKEAKRERKPVLAQVEQNNTALIAYIAGLDAKDSAAPLPPDTAFMLSRVDALYHTMFTIATQPARRLRINAFHIMEAWARTVQSLWVFDDELAKASKRGSSKKGSHAAAQRVSMMQLPYVDRDNIRDFRAGVNLREFTEVREHRGPKLYSDGDEVTKLCEESCRRLPAGVARDEAMEVCRSVLLSLEKSRRVTKDDLDTMLDTTVRVLEALPTALSAAQRRRVAMATTALPRSFTPEQRVGCARVIADLPLLEVEASMVRHHRAGANYANVDDPAEAADGENNNNEEGENNNKEEGAGAGAGAEGDAGDGDDKDKAAEAEASGDGGKDDSAEGTADEGEAQPAGDKVDKMRIGEAAMCQVSVSRGAYLAEGAKEVPSVYCPRWREHRQEVWWVFLVFNDVILCSKRVEGLEGEAGAGGATERLELNTYDVHLMAAGAEMKRTGRREVPMPTEKKPHKHTLQVHLKTNAYVGLDPPPKDVTLTLYPPLKDTPDTRDEKDKAQLLYDAMGSDGEYDSSDLDEDDDGDDAGGGARVGSSVVVNSSGHKLTKAQLRKRLRRQKGAKADADEAKGDEGPADGDDDGDDDGDGDGDGDDDE